GVELVEEQDAGAILTSELARLAVQTHDGHNVHAHEHTRDRGGREITEGNASLGRDAVTKVRLARAGGADQKDATRHLAAHCTEVLDAPKQGDDPHGDLED